MTPEDSKRLDDVNRKLDEILRKLDRAIEVNEKLDRLLAILEGPDMEKERLEFCLKESHRGNWKPLEEYKRRGGKIIFDKTKRGQA